MPRILPPGSEVDWPDDEGTIGVVGFSPWSALDFCRLLWSFIPVRKEWEYPRIIADFNTKIPSRGRHLELGETDPSPAIRDTIGELGAAGATVAAVPCNTAHLLFDRWGEDSPIPIAHIGHSTAMWVSKGMPGPVCVLSSLSIWKSGCYQRWLGEAGITIEPTYADEAKKVSDVINSIKHAHLLEAGVIMAELGSTLHKRGLAGVILGCTELALAADATVPEFALPCLDSNKALAIETLRMAKVRIKPPASLWRKYGMSGDSIEWR